jgi:8-oxo-dGTP pyrophosphatase MutT (NUDIX family)
MVPNAVKDGSGEQVIARLRAFAAGATAARDRALAEEFVQFAGAHADCLLRSCLPGHFTGSAWVVDPARRRTLLTHHRKLDKWLQLGGHADGEADLLAVAVREAQEESGLTRVKAVTTGIFDLDRHLIPARKNEPTHWHYDVRFLLEADPTEPVVVSSESKSLAWVDLAEVAQLNPEESMLRMVRKTANM